MNVNWPTILTYAPLVVGGIIGGLYWYMTKDDCCNHDHDHDHDD